MFCVKEMDEKAMVRNSVLVMRIGQKSGGKCCGCSAHFVYLQKK